MAAITTKSSAVTNLGSPESLISPANEGHISEIIDSVTVGSNNTTLDKFLLAPIQSNKVITSLLTYNDALDSSNALTMNVGIANGPTQFTDTTGTVYAPYQQISQTLFSSAGTTFRAAVTSGTQLVGGAVSTHSSELQDAIWKRAGLGADPGVQLLVQVQIQTVATTNNATGTLTVKAASLGAR